MAQENINASFIVQDTLDAIFNLLLQHSFLTILAEHSSEEEQTQTETDG